MAKLDRVTAKVFAANAAADEIGQFGSAVAGSKLETSDVATIQALSAWLDGWSEALVSGNRYPALQEMNGLLKVLSYQGAYALQEGIAEYDSATTYYIGSIVKKTGTFKLYGSLIDTNVGNTLVDGTNWKFLGDLSEVGSGVSIFDNKGTVTTDIILAENKITTAYFSGSTTITLPTITDTSKQVTCVLDFTTATTNQPTIIDTNLRWSNKPDAYSILSEVRNILTFKSIWENSTLYWEVEYSRFGGVELTFTDSFNRSNTYASNRNPEQTDANNWYAYSNISSSNVGISSNTLALGFVSVVGWVSYRRNVEDYSNFVECNIEFDWQPQALTTSCDFGISIGSNTLPTTYIQNVYDGIMFKYKHSDTTLHIDNVTNKSTSSFTATAGTTYKIKIYCTPTFMGVKIYPSSSGEPTSYTIEYSGTLITSGNYLSFIASNNTSSGSCSFLVDNLNVIITK